MHNPKNMQVHNCLTHQLIENNAVPLHKTMFRFQVPEEITKLFLFAMSTIPTAYEVLGITVRHATTRAVLFGPS
jgi:hypothetical protein